VYQSPAKKRRSPSTNLTQKMKALKTTSLLALALAAAANSQALAQEGSPRRDGDGAARLGEMIKRMDTNADGKISKDEVLEGAKKEAEDRFSKMDTNADGQADEAELRAISEKVRDSGRRGEEGMRRPEGGGFRRPPEGGSPGSPQGGPGGPQGGPGMGMRGMGNPAEALRNADANKDGAIDKDEFRAMRSKESDEQFSRMDGNADGKITQEEFQQIGERMRAMMGNRGGPEGMRRPGGEGGGFRRPGGEGGEGGGFRRPPSQDGPKPEGSKPDAPKPESEPKAEAPKGV
jgi:hypothetical protein